MTPAKKTGMTAYVRKGSTRKAYAAKITSMLPLPTGGNVRLYFGEEDKIANVKGEWFGRCNPTVGGYFVVEETDGLVPNCYFAAAGAFEADFERAPS